MNSKLELTNLINPLMDMISLTEDHFSHVFKNGLKEYVIEQSSKYLQVNTFLNRYEKVNFYDAYYPVKVLKKNEKFDFETPSKIFKKEKYIVLIGGAGSGKSTITKYLFLQSIKKNFKIPVLIELRHLNDKEFSIEEFIVQFLLDIKIEPSLEYLEIALSRNKYFIKSVKDE